MEENEIILEGEYGEYISEESSPLGGEESSSPEEDSTTVTDEQILDAIRSVIDENVQSDIEGDSLLDEPIVSPSVSPSVENIDYTSLLTDIKNQQIETNSKLETIISDNNKTIFEKSLNEYNVTDTILIFLVVFGLGFVVVQFIKKFTPRIWH